MLLLNSEEIGCTSLQVSTYDMKMSKCSHSQNITPVRHLIIMMRELQTQTKLYIINLKNTIYTQGGETST
jgi:hypothetical protein